MSHYQNEHSQNLITSLNVGLRFESQIKFIKEIDALKNVWRQTQLFDCSRRENDAEHSWEMATMALILNEYFDDSVDISQVIRMLLIHDLVEIYAGDTFIYDKKSLTTQAERELSAAHQLFGLLPSDQEEEFRSLWEDFEARKTPEALAARALDRFQPLLHSYLTAGENWRTNNVNASSVRKIMKVIGEGSAELGAIAESMIVESIKRGYLKEEDAE